MDQRLHIADHLEEMIIGPDDPFTFHCTQCGKCCINRNDILLNPKDLFRISQYLGLKPQETVEKYCEPYIGGTSRIPIVRLKPQGSVMRCPLLKDRKCSVHPVKPTVCAMFPIGRCIRWEKGREAEEGIKIEYILMDPGCGDRSETHTVREWLGSFGIPAGDPWFLMWQKAVTGISAEIRKAEAQCPKNIMEILWHILYVALYLKYDIRKDFDGQFQANLASLKKAIRVFPVDGEGGDV